MYFSNRMISAYLDGELPERAAGRLRERLAGCPDCRQAVRELEEVAGLLSEWDPGRDSPAAAELDRVRQKVLAATAGRGRRMARPGRLRAVALAFLLTLVVLSGWVAGTSLRRLNAGPALPGISSLAESPEESLGSIYVQLLASGGAP